MFLELLNQGELDKVTVDLDKSEKLIHLLDTVVIKLEGGDEDDLRALEETPSEGINIAEKPGIYLSPNLHII